MAAVYQLLAFPGTGKLTIANEIVRQLTERGEQVALLDNHATGNLIWSVMRPGTRRDPEVLKWLVALRNVVLDAIDEIGAPDCSLVFTNYLPPARPPTFLDRHRAIALDHGRAFVPVVLELDPEELLRRVPNDDRRARGKQVNPVRAREQLAEGMTIPDWPELVHLDINGLTADEAARRIIAMTGAR